MGDHLGDKHNARPIRLGHIAPYVSATNRSHWETNSATPLERHNGKSATTLMPVPIAMLNFVAKGANGKPVCTINGKRTAPDDHNGRSQMETCNRPLGDHNRIPQWRTTLGDIKGSNR